MAGINTAARPDAPKPWEQLPGENASQYSKFCKYRDMKYIGPRGETLDGMKAPFGERSLRGLARQLGLKYYQPIGRLSVIHHWLERCEAYDLEIDRLAREQAEREILKMRKDHADLAAQMIKKAARRLLTISEEQLSAADIARLVDVGVKIERLSRGESTENKQISGETTVNHAGIVTVKRDPQIDLSALSDEELEQLDGLLAKLHPESDV